ncbi:hypothetical protein LSAT2_000486 [Lamellibrachia satsuma]|nr:hypothetical protein LSAT2_000486 [Lamellibrachia satsuma]
MALELTKLINCNVADSDQDKINNLLEEYLCGSGNKSDTDSDSESEICNGKSSDEDDDLDNRRNAFEDAMEVAADSVEIVMDSLDEKLKTVTSFRCSCQHNKGHPCYNVFSPQEIVAVRMKMADFSPREQMLIFLGKLSTLMNMSETVVSSGRPEKARQHQRMSYYVHGHQLCRDTFKFMHAISQNRLTSLISWYRMNGLVPKEKRSGGRRYNVRAHTFEDIKRAIAFISNYAEDHALALPGRIPGCKRDVVKLLPSSETKVKVYSAYKSACQQAGQNKNRFVLWYCAWRVAIGLHQFITLNFLIVGHTKFAPDACFGLLKRAFKRHAISSLSELESVVNGSACLNSSQFDAASPGVVFAKTNCDTQEEKFDLLGDSQLPKRAPAAISPLGLSLERQRYLHKNICPFVKECWWDVLCPCPPESEDAPVAGPSTVPDTVRGGKRGRGRRPRQPSSSPSPTRSLRKRGQGGAGRGQGGARL